MAILCTIKPKDNEVGDGGSISGGGSDEDYDGGQGDDGADDGDDGDAPCKWEIGQLARSFKVGKTVKWMLIVPPDDRDHALPPQSGYGKNWVLIEPKPGVSSGAGAAVPVAAAVPVSAAFIELGDLGLPTGVHSLPFDDALLLKGMHTPAFITNAIIYLLTVWYYYVS